MATLVTGLDPDTLNVALKSINEFAERELPDALLIELDERDECPEEICLILAKASAFYIAIAQVVVSPRRNRATRRAAGRAR